MAINEMGWRIKGLSPPPPQVVCRLICAAIWRPYWTMNTFRRSLGTIADQETCRTASVSPSNIAQRNNCGNVKQVMHALTFHAFCVTKCCARNLNVLFSHLKCLAK